MSTTKTIKLRVGVSVNYIANSTRESVYDTGYTRAEWDAMSEDERDKILDDYAQDELSNSVEAWAYVDGED